MPELVALDLAAGSAFVDALSRVWERGDAACPVDQRLPDAMRRQLVEAMGAAMVIGSDLSEHRLASPSQPVEDGDALVVCTSGTTGSPKGVVLTREALSSHALAVHKRLAVDRSRDRWLSCLPLSHVGGLGVITRSLLDDVGLDVLAGFDALVVGASPRDLGTTLVSLVPTALDRLDPSLFRRVLLGGSGDQRARPDNVTHTYGLTETGGGVIYDGWSLDGVDLRLHGAMIEVRGPSLLRTYRDGTDPFTADGWFVTGDLGELAADGRLIVHGRSGDLIISGGENVWPGPVETALIAHGKVAEVAVFGRPDAEWGQRVTALVVPVDASDPPSLDELRHLVKETLPAFSAPRELLLTAKIERTALGKVRRDAPPMANSSDS